MPVSFEKEKSSNYDIVSIKITQVSYEENIGYMRGLQKRIAEKVLMPNLYQLWEWWLFLADSLAISIRSNYLLSLFIIAFVIAGSLLYLFRCCAQLLHTNENIQIRPQLSLMTQLSLIPFICS